MLQCLAHQLPFPAFIGVELDMLYRTAAALAKMRANRRAPVRSRSEYFFNAAMGLALFFTSRHSDFKLIARRRVGDVKLSLIRRGDAIAPGAERGNFHQPGIFRSHVIPAGSRGGQQ